MHYEKHKIVVRPADRFTPVGLAKKLNAIALLESSSLNMYTGRYSILLIQEAFRVIADTKSVYIQFPDGRTSSFKQYTDILDALLQTATQHKDLHTDFPLPAGGLGYLSYEYCQFCNTIQLRKKKASLQLPMAMFLFGHIFAIFDHYCENIFYVGINYQEASIDLSAALITLENKINDMDFTYLQHAPHYDISSDSSSLPQHDHFYKNAISHIHQYIEDGEIYQCVMSRRLKVQNKRPAFENYRQLRRLNPAPYLFYFDFGTFQLMGSSPEVHVKVKDKKAIMHPIAGTRRRGHNAQEDRHLAKELQNDAKERAEHLMLVDLARNDLGKIAVPDTIQVESFMQVEYFATVMHMVSRLQAIVRDGLSSADVLRATFPSGTVSGAPKIRSMEIIDQLEEEQREFYAGVTGYFDAHGNCDTCITIRSAVQKEDHIYIQAGAGIVYDSHPDRELDETKEKLFAFMNMLGVQEL